jgi:aspartate aminotransferase
MNYCNYSEVRSHKRKLIYMKETPVLSFSKSVLELKTAKTFEYSQLAAALAKKGMRVISFGIGQPDFATPKYIVDAAVDALRQGFTRYVQPPGIQELREEIAKYVSVFTGALDVKPEETLVMPGAKQAIFFAIASYIEPGDEVIIPDPSFYSYAHVTRYAGGKPIFLPLREENNFRIRPEDVQSTMTPKTKMIVLNSPHNPTGGLLTKSDIDGILELAKTRRILVVSDEVYDHYVYEGEFTSVLIDPEWRDFVICINSFSKTFSMTGWRLGYIIAGREAIERLTLFAVNSFSCTTSFVQKAGVTALKESQEFFKAVLDDYRKRRDFMYRELDAIPGIKAKKPAGAFYVFPNVKEILAERKLATEEFAVGLMRKTGVVTLPGSAFSHKAGEGYLRFSYVLPLTDIREGLRRFKTGIFER